MRDKVEFGDGLLVEQRGQGCGGPGFPNFQRKNRISFEPKVFSVDEADILQGNCLVEEPDSGGESGFVVSQKESGESHPITGITSFKLGIDRVEDQCGGAERTDLPQTSKKSTATSLGGTFSIPIEKSSSRK